MSIPKAPEVIPLAPDDIEELRQNYANVALGYHKKLPGLEAGIDNIRGIALAAHGIASANLDETKRVKAEVVKVQARLEDLAFAVGAKKTYTSGQFAAATAVSMPPQPPQPLEIKTRRTGTGSHWIIENDELQKIQAKWAEKEAEERGAKQALAEQAAVFALEEAASKARRDRFAFWMTILVVVGGFVGWAIGHVTVH